MEKPNLNLRIKKILKVRSARINITKNIGSIPELCFADFAISI